MIKKILNFQNREKRIIKNIFLSLIIRGVGVFISFYLMPTYMGFFTQDSTLGLWFTILAMLSWFMTFDLCIGNGLRNNLAKPLLENNRIVINKMISSSYAIISLLVLVISLISVIVFKFINWNTLFKTTFDNALLYKVILILFFSIMIQFILKIVYPILYALQKPNVVSLTALASNILLLIGIKLLPILKEEDNLFNLSILYLLTSIIPVLLTTFITYKFLLNNNFPKFNNIDIQLGKSILSLGSMFFLIQILYLILSNTNEVFITATINSKDVVSYKIYNSLFNSVSMFFFILMTPMWSEISSAYVNKEIKWLKNLNKKLNKLLMLSIIGLFMIALLSQYIIDFWLNEKTIQVNYFYIAIFCLSVFVSMWNSIVSSFANGMSKLKNQLIFMTIGVSIFLFLIYITKVYQNWILIVLANSLSLMPYCISQTIWLRKYFKNA